MPDVNAILPAFNMPAPTARRFRFGAALIIVMAPDTVRVFPEEIFTVLFAVVCENVSDVQAALAVTVTVNPPVMVTSSPATGIWAPLHVVVAFQFPVAAEDTEVAIAVAANKTVSTMTNAQSTIFFMVFSEKMC